MTASNSPCFIAETRRIVRPTAPCPPFRSKGINASTRGSSANNSAQTFRMPRDKRRCLPVFSATAWREASRRDNKGECMTTSPSQLGASTRRLNAGWSVRRLFMTWWRAGSLGGRSFTYGQRARDDCGSGAGAAFGHRLDGLHEGLDVHLLPLGNPDDLGPGSAPGPPSAFSSAAPTPSWSTSRSALCPWTTGR